MLSMNELSLGDAVVQTCVRYVECLDTAPTAATYYTLPITEDLTTRASRISERRISTSRGLDGATNDSNPVDDVGVMKDHPYLLEPPTPSSTLDHVAAHSMDKNPPGPRSMTVEAPTHHPRRERKDSNHTKKRATTTSLQAALQDLEELQQQNKKHINIAGGGRHYHSNDKNISTSLVEESEEPSIVLNHSLGSDIEPLPTSPPMPVERESNKKEKLTSSFGTTWDGSNNNKKVSSPKKATSTRPQFVDCHIETVRSFSVFRLPRSGRAWPSDPTSEGVRCSSVIGSRQSTGALRNHREPYGPNHATTMKDHAAAVQHHAVRFSTSTKTFTASPTMSKRVVAAPTTRPPASSASPVAGKKTALPHNAVPATVALLLRPTSKPKPKSTVSQLLSRTSTLPPSMSSTDAPTAGEKVPLTSTSNRARVMLNIAAVRKSASPPRGGIIASNPLEAVVGPPSHSPSAFCADCGEKYLMKAKFCAYCGHKREFF